MNELTIGPKDGPRIRVLYVECSWDGTAGGSHFSLLHLVKSIREFGFDPIVVFRSDHPAMDRYAGAHIPTHTLPVKRPIHTPHRWLVPITRGSNAVGRAMASTICVWRFLQLLRTEHIQLVHLNNSVDQGLECQIAARLARIPCLTHQRGYLDKVPIGARVISRSLRAMICVSESVRQNLLSRGFDPVRTITIHNGIDVQTFRRSGGLASVRTEFGLDLPQPVIGIVGNIQKWKGQDVVIRAVDVVRRAFPGVVCLIVGDVARAFRWDVEYWESLQRQIRDLKLERSVILTGYRENVSEYLNAMDVVIHASVEGEPFGRVIIEAMAMGKPVVAARDGGVPEIVVDGLTGYLYTPGNSNELAERLCRLLGDRQKQLIMGKAGYDRVLSEFDSTTNARRTAAVYRAVLGSLSVARSDADLEAGTREAR